MNKLKNNVVKYFICCSLAICVAESVIDSIFEEWLLPGQNADETGFIMLLAAWLVISILIFLVGAYSFYLFIRKAIELESKRQMQEQNLLFSCIAHDLKTPMTSVQGFASALKEGRIKSDEQMEVFDIIYKKSCYINELVETLSTYSNLGTENYSINRTKINLCALVRDLAASNYAEFEDKGIELRIEIPEEPIYFQLDEKEFRRAVNNLIINAYRHNSSGTAVLIKVHVVAGTVFVTIADNGKEINKELLEKMFDPFICGNASRTSGSGSGLGLAIAARIVERHDAKLYVENDINGYTKRFVIQLGRSTKL